MIPYSLILKILITVSLITGCCLSLKNWKDKAVNKAILELTTQIQNKENELALLQQEKALNLQNIIFKESQKITKNNYLLETQINNNSNIEEQLEIKENIINQINCILSNFNDKKVCE
jgi:hypothetical protein